MRLAREVPGLELVAIGPLTNLARALALDPELPRRVAGLTVMGGHVREVRIGKLLCRPGIDYNLCSDPEASMAVLGAGFATRLVTADVTLQTWLTRADLARLDAAGALPARARPPGAHLDALAGEDLQRDRRHPRPGERRLPPRPAHDAGARRPGAAPLRAPAHPADDRARRAPHPRGAAGLPRLGAEMEVATAVDARRAAAAILERLLRLPWARWRSHPEDDLRRGGRRAGPLRRLGRLRHQRRAARPLRPRARRARAASCAA